MKTVAIVEARMTSSRLPGKPLLPILDRPAISHLIERLRLVPSLDAIVLATTHNAADDPLAAYASGEKIACFRGSEQDVMGRVLEAARSVSADLIVEVTGDCIVNDPEVVERTIQHFNHKAVDYVSNCHEPGFPIGIDAQVFRTNTLARSERLTTDALDREHVTRHILRSPEFFSRALLRPEPGECWPDLALALDEQPDVAFLTAILSHFRDHETPPSCREIISLLKDIHPEWLKINDAVKRKGIDE